MSAVNNPQAFPVPNDANVNGQEGMTLRDWFAGQALNGLLASGKWDNCGVGFEAYIAGHASNIADAMLAERAKGGAA